MTLMFGTDILVQVEEERRSRGVFSRSSALEEKHQQLRAALEAAPIARLKELYADRIANDNTPTTIELGAEFCRRGIAPCFRGIGHDWFHAGHPDTDRLLAICDMQWIVARYPKHRPEWKRLSSIRDSDQKSFLKAADYVLYGGRRTAGQVAKALGLTTDQQRECLWIQRLDVARWRVSLMKRWPTMQGRITDAIRRIDLRDETAQDETIARRQDLWLCAEIADWKPQRTADLYAMKTGVVLARNLVANQLDKIREHCRTDKKFRPK
jgi:hypothetical protein